MKALTELSSVRRRLQWPLEAKGIEKIMERMGTVKQDFYLALAGDLSIEVNKTQDAVLDVKETVEDMKAAEMKQKILEWLGGPDQSVIHNNLKAKREPGTCEWLLQSDDFQRWFKIGGRLMWLHGFPGAGKSFLSSAAIGYVRTQPLSAEYAIAYYYFDFRDLTRQTLDGLLRSLVAQICSQANSLPNVLLDLYEICRGSSPSADQLVCALKDLIQNSFRIYVLIDAVDESPEAEYGERSMVMETLAEIKMCAAQRLSIFVASRPESDITERMKVICDIDINLQSALVNEDIRLHIRTCLSRKDDKLHRWPQSIKDDIEEELMTGAGGMFRWVVCQLDELRKCLKPARIRETLKTLPKTLDATYQRILENVPSQYHTELRTALIFLAFSTRPMSIQEVAEATAINIEEHSFSVNDRFGDAYDILEICSSLVSLSPITQAVDLFHKEGIRYYTGLSFKPEVRFLQLAHFSVKEYFITSRAQKSLPGVFRINEILSHSHITQACLTYLLDFNGGKKLVSGDLAKFPLLVYSALHWTTHLSLSKNAEWDAVDSLVRELFDPQNENHLINFLNMYTHDPSEWRIDLSLNAVKRSTEDFMHPLFYAAFFGLIPLTESLLRSIKSDEVQSDILATALAGAAAAGHVEVIGMLIGTGANVNSALSRDLLCAAVQSGNPAAVRRLIEAGAPIRDGSVSEGNALHAACIEGEPEVIQLLLDYGFDIHKRSQENGAPLSIALRRQNDEAVRVLVQNGADVNFPTEGCWNPLFVASGYSSRAIVELLLKNGAQTAPRTNPLAKAAKNGNLEMTKLLLQHGASINDEDDEIWGTALQGAIRSRDAELFEYVLSEGADINQKGRGDVFPLKLAISYGNVVAAETLWALGAQFSDFGLSAAVNGENTHHFAKIMLSKGADPNAEHEGCGCILQYAMYMKDDQLALDLLDAGADPSGVPDGRCGTPLQMAVERGNEVLVRLFLERGGSVNPDRLYGNYGDPLCAAIRAKNQKIIKLLLDHGAALDRAAKDYNPPLHCAAALGHKNTVQLLLEKGANVNAVSGQFGTALTAALAYGHDDVARYLLDKGADFKDSFPRRHATMVSQFEHEFQSAFEVALETNKTSTVGMLLDRGLDLNNSKACVGSLEFALQLPGMTMLEFLVYRGINVADLGAKTLARSYWSSESMMPEKIKYLLSKGAKLPIGDEFGENRLLVGSLTLKDRETFNFLLDAGIDPNATSRGLHGSALNLAVCNNDMDAITKLLDKGADVNLHAGAAGWSSVAGMLASPFINAIAKGDKQLYRLFLDHQANIDAKSLGHFGNPLEAAISRGYYSIAHNLIDCGADVNLPGYYGSLLTPACQTPRVGQMLMIKRLLSLGVDPNSEDTWHPNDIHSFMKSILLLTPLQAAVDSRNEELIDLLLNSGAVMNPTQPQGTYGNPLQMAVHRGYEDQVKLLVRKGANVNAIGGHYGTSLQAAVAQESDEFIGILLNAGADPAIEAGYYGSPLQAACRHGNISLVKLFLGKGVPVNTNVGKYGTPLAAAAKRANKNIVELLLDAGANVNQLGGKYGTSLQAACCAKLWKARQNARDILGILIDKGAEVNTVNLGKYGTPLQAAAYHSKEYVEILIRHGADLNAEGGKYGSALNAAKSSHHQSFLTQRLLIHHGAVSKT